MDPQKPLLSDQHHLPNVTRDTADEVTTARPVATRDHEVIRQWAARHQAEPATGEATRSGPATLDVRDGGTGIRFNFPGLGRFRPIAWEEWLEHFDRNGLTFVYEQAPEHALPPDNRYRIVKTADWKEQVG